LAQQENNINMAKAIYKTYLTTSFPVKKEGLLDFFIKNELIGTFILAESERGSEPIILTKHNYQEVIALAKPSKFYADCSFMYASDLRKLNEK